MGRLSLHNINPMQEESLADAAASGHSMACVINSEVSAVLAVMRRNVRWSGRFASADDDSLDHSLIHSFKSLRRLLFSYDPNRWSSVDPTLYLRPFLDVIRSDETGAPITGVALSSVQTILAFEVFDEGTANVEEAMSAIVEAVTSCRFEVTDPASEEAVLMKILQLLLACMRCRASRVLGNQHVCTIVNTCFRVVHQAGTKGELLQRISRHTMHELVRCIFSRLPEVSERTFKVSPDAEFFARMKIDLLSSAEISARLIRKYEEFMAHRESLGESSSTRLSLLKKVKSYPSKEIEGGQKLVHPPRGLVSKEVPQSEVTTTIVEAIRDIREVVARFSTLIIIAKDLLDFVPSIEARL